MIFSCVFAEKIVFSANHLSGVIGDKSDATSLSGEAYVLTESIEISADNITMSGEDFRFIEADGNIKGKNMEAELEWTCDKLKYDRETKIASLSENVNLIDTKNDVNAKAQLIEYNQDTDIAIMQIDIELKQKDNVCTGVYAVYQKKEQLLDLSGNAQIKQGDDTFRAQEITLDLDSQEITLDGRVKGSVIDERKTEENKEDETTNDGKETDALKASEKTDATDEVAETTTDTTKTDASDKNVDETATDTSQTENSEDVGNTSETTTNKTKASKKDKKKKTKK